MGVILTGLLLALMFVGLGFAAPILWIAAPIFALVWLFGCGFGADSTTDAPGDDPADDVLPESAQQLR